MVFEVYQNMRVMIRIISQINFIMKFNCATLFLVIFATILMVPANGQISKGDYILDFNPFISDSNVEGRHPSVIVRGTYLKMITDRIMIGGGIGFVHSQYLTTSSGDDLFFPYNQFQLSPTFRYYFSNGKISPFASLQNRITFTNFSGPRLEDEFRFNQTLGLGANYFIGDHVVLEGLLSFNVLDLGDSFDPAKTLNLGLGVKLFFTDALKNDVDHLSDKIFRKGVIETSGNFLSINHRFNETFKGSFSLFPRIRYFIKDRLSVVGEFNYASYYFADRRDYDIGGSLGLAYFHKLIEDFYLKLDIQADISHSKFGRGTNFERSSETISVPLSAELQYLHKQKRIYIGASYSTNKIDLDDRFFDDVNRNSLRAYLGLDYFVQDNVYFKGEFDFFRRKDDGVEGSLNRTNLTFGVGFFFSR